MLQPQRLPNFGGNNWHDGALEVVWVKLSWALRTGCSSVLENNLLLPSLRNPTARGAVMSGCNVSALLGGMQESSMSDL